MTELALLHGWKKVDYYNLAEASHAAWFVGADTTIVTPFLPHSRSLLTSSLLVLMSSSSSVTYDVDAILDRMQRTCIAPYIPVTIQPHRPTETYFDATGQMPLAFVHWPRLIAEIVAPHLLEHIVRGFDLDAVLDLQPVGGAGAEHCPGNGGIGSSPLA